MTKKIRLIAIAIMMAAVTSLNPVTAQTIFAALDHATWYTFQYRILSDSTVELKGILDDEDDIGVYLNLPRSVSYGTNTYVVTEIAESAFADLDNNSLEPIQIRVPNSVKKIGDYAFAGAWAYVNVPDSVEFIGTGAYDLNNWDDTYTGPRNVTIPRTCRYLGGNAFDLYPCIDTVFFLADSCNVGDTISYLYTSWPFQQPEDSSLVLIFGEHVRYIDEYAFSKLPLRGELRIPQSVRTIGRHAFEDTPISSVVFEDSPTAIGDSAFKDCDSLTSISLGNAVTSIGTYAFGMSVNRGPAYTDSLIIPYSCTYIGSGAFAGTYIRSTLSVSNPSTLIGQAAFQASLRSRNTDSVYINTHSIDLRPYSGILAGAPYHDDFRHFVIGDSVRVVKGGPMRVSNLTVGCSVDSMIASGVGDELFEQVVNVYYTGSLAQWCGINFCGPEDYFMEFLRRSGWRANPLFSSKRLFINGVDVLPNLVIPEGVTEIKPSAFVACATIIQEYDSIADSVYLDTVGIQTLSLPSTLTSVGEDAFYGCSNIVGDWNLPHSLISICDGAFSGCAGLTGTLTIPDSLKYLGKSAFSSCSGITDIDFGPLDTIPYSAFSGTGIAGDFHIPEQIRYIDTMAFSYCDSLKTVILPDHITRLPHGVFGNCYSLSYIHLPDSLQIIETAAFLMDASLKTISIPEYVTSLGQYSFAGCTSLDTIWSNAANPPAVFDEQVFVGVRNNIPVYVPCGAQEAYRQATGWQHFSNIRCIGESIEYTVTASSSDTAMGTVTGGGVYADGATATLTAIPAPCHQFSGWGDGVADNPRSLTVNADTTITAIFAPIAAATGDVAATACDSYTWNGQTCTASGTYTFATSTVAGCDSIATLSLTLNYSVADTLEATATESYDWNGQTYTESGTYTYSGTTVHGCDSTVTLLLTIEPPVVYYTVTVASSDDAMGSVLGGGTYEAGTEVTLTATPAEGHEFVQWSDGFADNPRTLVLTSDTIFVAQFQPEVGIQHPTSDLRLTIHPNPARSTVTLSGLEPGAKVTIVDLNGREVLSLTTDNGTLTTDVSSLTSGAYFVRVTGERQAAVRKLIVK